MDAALVLAGLALGGAASPHCALMCAAPCAALTRGSGCGTAGFHLGRLAGYMAGGALAAASMAALSTWTEAVPVLRPVWTLLHLGFLALGLWWLATGRQPLGMLRDGEVPVRVVSRRRQALRASLAGLAWVAWPCAALQAAMLLAALANGPLGGALVMAAFAAGSMPGLALAPWAWARWQAWQAARGTTASPARVAELGYRVAGMALVLASGWALGHGAWGRFAAWCAGPPG